MLPEELFGEPDAPFPATVRLTSIIPLPFKKQKFFTSLLKVEMKMALYLFFQCIKKFFSFVQVKRERKTQMARIHLPSGNTAAE